MGRRLGPALLAAGLLVAACGGGDDGAAVSSTTTAGGASTTVAPDPTTGSTAPGTARDDGEAPSGSGATGGPGAPAAPGPAPTEPARSPGGVGDLAAPLLRPGNGDRVVVEVRAQAGAEPRAATVDRLLGRLRAASGKDVVADGIDPLGGGGQSWSASSIAAAADGAADLSQGGSQIVLRLLFVHGTFEGESSVLGVAVRGDVAAVFTDQVERAAGLLTSPATVEDAVTTHEVGHLLGLVDLVVDTGRADPEHPGHSSNRGSVMYWAVESDLVGQVLGGGIPTEYDEQDRADLARIRAG
jgi:hypothetical protein